MLYICSRFVVSGRGPNSKGWLSKTPLLCWFSPFTEGAEKNVFIFPVSPPRKNRVAEGRVPLKRGPNQTEDQKCLNLNRPHKYHSFFFKFIFSLSGVIIKN